MNTWMTLNLCLAEVDRLSLMAVMVLGAVSVMVCMKKGNSSGEGKSVKNTGGDGI